MIFLSAVKAALVKGNVSLPISVSANEDGQGRVAVNLLAKNIITVQASLQAISLSNIVS